MARNKVRYCFVCVCVCGCCVTLCDVVPGHVDVSNVCVKNNAHISALVEMLVFRCYNKYSRAYLYIYIYWVTLIFCCCVYVMCVVIYVEEESGGGGWVVCGWFWVVFGCCCCGCFLLLFVWLNTELVLVVTRCVRGVGWWLRFLRFFGYVYLWGKQKYKKQILAWFCWQRCRSIDLYGFLN